MDELDFDDIELALSEVTEHNYLVHFIGSLDEDDADSDVCFSLNATEFARHLSWAQSRSQDFAKEYLPRVVFVDPAHLLLEDSHAYALEDYDYENLMDRLDLSNPRVASEW